MQLLGIFPQLILVPYLINRIGEGGYGIYALVWSLLASIDQLEKSLQSGVVKYSAGFIAERRIDDVSKILSTSFISSLFIGAIFCVMVLAAAMRYKASDEGMGFSLVIIGFMLLVIIPVTPFVGIAQSKQRYYIGAIADTASKYVSLVVVVIWFSIYEPSVEALIIIMAVVLLISRASQIPFAYRLMPGLRNNFSLFDIMSLRKVGAFGAVTVVASLCLALNSTGVRWLMSELVSTTFVTHLVIILMPTLLLSQIIGAMTVTAMPAASAYAATGRQDGLNELLLRGTRYTVTLCLGILLGAMVAMTEVITVWVGHDYEFLTPYALVLLVACALMQSTSVAHHILKGIGKLNIVVFTYFIGLVVTPLTLILSMLHLQQNPYLSVTAGLSAGYFVTGIMQLFFCMKLVNANPGHLLVASFAKPIAAVSVPFILAIGMYSVVDIGSAPWVILLAIIMALVYYSICYFTIFSVNEREEITSLMRLVSGRIAALIGR